MSLSAAGVWAVDVWDQTVWADDVWREGEYSFWRATTDNPVTWAVTTDNSINYNHVNPTENLWDSESTLWDVSGNVETTNWDTTLTTYTEVGGS